ncbi:hypothetical protein DFH06DRAFT_1325923 [Mycena polygramma]|nr:hypothetical protein DFH06DRAFT_1325923 [Mycena polygramma]
MSSMASSTNNPSPSSPPPTSSTPSPSSKPPTPPPPPPTSPNCNLSNRRCSRVAMQRTPAAWGLVVPLLAHEDANVQFFGAHTAHANIARGDLARLPPQERLPPIEGLVGLAGVPRAKVVLMQLYLYRSKNSARRLSYDFHRRTSRAVPRLLPDRDTTSLLCPLSPCPVRVSGSCGDPCEVYKRAAYCQMIRACLAFSFSFLTSYERPADLSP